MSIHTWPLLQHSCWLAMHPIYQTLYIYIVLFSLLSVFSLSSFSEDLIKFLLIWIQLGLLLCKGQILPFNIKGNCRITGSQDQIGPQRSQSQQLSAWDQNPQVQNYEPRAGSTEKSHQVAVMDRNVANVFHTAEDTQGPCIRCQHHTGVEILLFTEGSLRWQACLESLSKHFMLQILKPRPSHQRQVSKQKSQSSGSAHRNRAKQISYFPPK